MSLTIAAVIGNDEGVCLPRPGDLVGSLKDVLEADLLRGEVHRVVLAALASAESACVD
jgi:hypothetical protein